MTRSNRVCYLRMSSSFAGKGRRWSARANLLLGMAAIGCLWGLSGGAVRGEDAAEEGIPDPVQPLYVMDADGGNLQLLVSLPDYTACGSPRWSPAGRKLAWTTYSGGANITVYDLIEGTRHTVLEGEHRRYSAIYWNFDWSPNSKRLCFKGLSQDGEELVIVKAAGSSHGHKVRLQAKTGSNIAWHPDGKQIAFYKSCPERKYHQVYVMDANSKKPPALLAGQDPERINTDPTWSPDGEKILFCSKKPPPGK